MKLRKKITAILLSCLIFATGILLPPPRKSEAMSADAKVALITSSGGLGTLLISIIFICRIPIANFFRSLIRNRSTFDCLKIDKIISDLRAELNQSVMGQEKAKEKIVRLVAGHLEAMQVAKYIGKEYKKGLVLYMIGLAGVGKTTAIHCIERALKKASYFVYRSDVKQDKSKNSQTVAQQLLEPEVQMSGNFRFEKDKPLALRLKNGSNILLVFDEYEKQLKCDNERSLDELILRDFVDSGKIGEYDCSNSIVIMTSNETRESMKENHDESILNRISECIIEFDGLTKDNYTRIIGDMFSPLKLYYSKYYKTEINLSEQAINELAKNMADKNNGARELGVIMGTLRGDLYKFRTEYKYKNPEKQFSGLKIQINYDRERGTFNFTEIN